MAPLLHSHRGSTTWARGQARLGCLSACLPATLSCRNGGLQRRASLRGLPSGEEAEPLDPAARLGVGAGVATGVASRRRG